MTVSLRVTLVAALWLAGSPLLAQTTFKYKFKQGDVLKYDLTIGNKVVGKAGDMDFGGVQKQIITMTWKVESVDDKGTAKIRLKVDRAKLSADSGKESVEVSSDMKEAPEKAKGMHALAIALAKFEAFFNLTAQGDIKNVTIPPEVIKAMKAVPGIEDADPMSPQALEATLRNTTLILPADPIAKGKSWKEKLEGKTPFGTYAGDTVFTYDGMVDRGGRTVSKFVVRPQIKIEPDPKAKVMLKGVETDGTVYFDAAAGQLVEVLTVQTIDLAGEDQGKKVTQRIETSNGLKQVK